jgi:hypothetical protein
MPLELCLEDILKLSQVFVIFFMEIELKGSGGIGGERKGNTSHLLSIYALLSVLPSP